MQFHSLDAFLARSLRPLAVLVLVLCGVGVMESAAQFATVRGRVTDAADAQPMPGATIVLENQGEARQVGTAADGNGYFVLSRIPPGSYLLRTSFVGYVERIDTLVLDFSEQHTLNLQLEADEAQMNEVVVVSEAGASAASAQAGFETIRPSALARIPTPGVSADLAGYLQTMPGVVTAGDRGGQLFVRGGTPTQNLILIDGIPVFQPFHIVGFYSAFPADIVAYADAYTSGFGARYGGRLSSVIDVATRNGNKQRVTGSASMAPFLSSVRIEVPFVPQRLSILASVRESVIERVSPDLLRQELPYRFGDLFVKAHAYLSRTSSLSLTALRTFDEGDVADTDGRPNRIRWSNEAYGGQLIYLPEEYPALAKISVYASSLDSRYDPFSAPEREALASTFGLEAGFIYYLGATELHTGLFGRSFGFEFDLGGGSRGQDKEFVSEGGMYMDARIKLGRKWMIEPGLRMHSFPSRSQVVWEPRMRAEFRPGGTEGGNVFSAAWGIYHQEIIGLYNARDVTDSFVAWTPSPENINVPRAMHFLAGWRGRLPAGFTLNLEGYYKDLANLAFAEFDENRSQGVRVDPVYGEAMGMDTKIEAVRPAFYGAVSYGLAKVTYSSFEQTFSPPHDRRHQVSALTRVSLRGYAVSLRWQFGSGLPFTQTAGFYNSVVVSAPEDAIRTRPGTPVLVTSEALYAARLPAYHRLDLSAERRFEWKHFATTLQAGAINVYNRANIFDYDVFAGQRVNQLPLIPSVGLKVEVR